MITYSSRRDRLYVYPIALSGATITAPRPLTAGLTGRMVFQGTRRPDATLHLVYLDADSRADAALDRIRRTVDNAPTNVEALLTRLEVAAIAGSADAGSTQSRYWRSLPPPGQHSSGTR